MEIVITTLIAIVIGVLIYILGINTGKPKLIVGGGGAGGGGAPDSIHHISIGIRNDPRFFGMRLDRKTAKIVKAFLKDKKTKEHYSLPCNWQVNGANNTSRETSIEVGERKNLNLFVKARNSNDYYVCGKNALEIADNAESFSDARKEFTLFIRDSLQREYRYDFIAINRKGHNVKVSSAITFAHRLYMVKEAFSLIFRAIKPSKFD